MNVDALVAPALVPSEVTDEDIAYAIYCADAHTGIVEPWPLITRARFGRFAGPWLVYARAARTAMKGWLP